MSIELFQVAFLSGSAFEITDNATVGWWTKVEAKYGLKPEPVTPEAIEHLRAGLADNTGRPRVTSFEAAEAVATLLGAEYIATDAGKGSWPRFGVTTKWKIGAKVSRGFNGDYYPEGEIISIGAGRRAMITTSTGAKFYRHKLTGSWRSEGGGTWRLVAGHSNAKNPSF